MNASTLTIGAILLLVIFSGLAFYGRRMWLDRRRTRTLRALLENADLLERDLKDCRQRLNRAHAVMSVVPGMPAAGETEARQSIDTGLRSVLEHRLWIRDHVTTASQQELDDAVTALQQARKQVEPQIRALDQAQRDLDQAVRERIERDAQA